MDSLEAVVLAGGASRRMGQDKSRLLVGGEPILERLVRLLAASGLQVTVLGGREVSGAAFMPDATAFAGPLTALADFTPSREFVFVVACDVVRFHPDVVLGLRQSLGASSAAIPLVEGRAQPLCAVYRASAFQLAKTIRAEGSTRLFDWVDRLDAHMIDERVLLTMGIEPRDVVGVNDPEALRWALEDAVQD